MMTEIGTSLVVQRLRLQASKSGGLSAIPDQATRSHMRQLRVHTPQLKDPESHSDSGRV